MHTRLMHSGAGCMQSAKYYMCRWLQVVLQRLYTNCTNDCVCISIQMQRTTQHTYAPNSDVLHECALIMRQMPNSNQPLCANTMLPPPGCDFEPMLKHDQPNHATRSGGRHTCEWHLAGTAAFILNDNMIGFVYIQLTSSTSQQTFICSTSC